MMTPTFGSIYREARFAPVQKLKGVGGRAEWPGMAYHEVRPCRYIGP
jgi:hypothetical protein